MTQKLQKIRRVLIALILLALFAKTGSASHTMGADLTYECLGGNTYKITVSFYRDCIGIAAPPSPYVTIKSASCNQNIGVTTYPRPGTGQEVTPACSSSVTTCNGGTFTGIQEWVYDGIITLPAQCTDWVFSYSLCCRNAAITTITNPGTSTFYIYSTLNNVITSCNSSPVFSNKPVPFLCLGQQYCFNHGAYDPDGDSLVYELITPKQTAGVDVAYMAPYNASNPLNSLPTTSFNSVTGDICLNPQNLEVTVMAVLVKEYRNGVLIGSVERDLQLTVMNCANNLPTLTGINGTNNFSITICANEATCFDIFSIDPDAGQNLEVTWDDGISGATFTTTNTARPTGTFCWTPTSADIGTSNIFTVRVADDACPYYGSQVYSYTVNVIGISVNAGPDEAISCSDFATLTASASGGTGTYTYLWSNGSTSQWITVGEGTYWVTANDGTCSATDTVVVSMPYIPVADFTHSATTCINIPISFTDQSTTPGGIIWSWTWDFGDGSGSSLQNPSHLFPGAGTYNVSLIIENTLGCRDTVIQQIIVENPPVAEFTYTNTCVGSAVSFTDQSTPTGTITSWNWNFGDGATSSLQNPSHTYSSTGAYTVTLISGNASGCIDTVVHIVTINPLPIANAGVDQSVCSGSSATLTAGGGTGYTWQPGGSTSGTIVVNPSGTTSYVVTVGDANGCFNTDTVIVSVLPLPVVNAGPDVSSCSSAPVTLTAGGADTYIWTPGGSTNSSITVNPSVSTNYTVVGIGTNGCTASDIVRINVNTLPVASAGPDQHICLGSNASLTATGGGTYSWMPGGNTGSTITVNPGTSTSYVVTVTNGSGCSKNDTVRVIVHNPPAITLQDIFLCTGSTAILDAGVSGATYTWLPNGETTRTITVSSGGNYTVHVTDTLGCSSSASATVTMGTAIAISLDDVSFCEGDSATLDVGYPGMDYLWTTGQTTQSITIHTGGTYGVIVDDNSGCTGSITVNAQTNPIPVANFSTNSVCAGNLTSFTDVSTIATGVITGWAWDFGDTSSSTLQNPTHIYSTPGTYTVSLTVTSAEGCTHTVSNTVTVNPLPVANFNAGSACQGAALAFTNTSTVSSGIISTYAWNFGDASTSSLQNPTHLYTGSGSFNVSLLITTAGGCSNTISRTVTVHPLPTANFNAAPVCSGASTIFGNTSSISTGTINNHSWDFGDTYTSTQSSPSHTYSAAGTYNVRYVATSGFGCSDTISKSVVVNAIPSANAGADQTICTGNTAVLSATGGTSYLWSPGASTASNITVNPLINTSYTVIVSDANSCSSTDIVNVVVNSKPIVSAGADRNLCLGNSVTLNASGAVTYSWVPGGATTSALTVNPGTNSTYYVTGTDANGCTSADTVNVTVSPLPTVSAGPDQSICSGSTIALTASGANSYVWNPGGGNTASILVSPVANSTYIVTGTSLAGCIKRDTINITVNPVPVVNLSPTFICPGFSTNLDAGNPGSTYTWSNGETTQTINVSDSGTYSVVVTSANGCPAMGTSTVTLGNNLSSNPVVTAVCDGNSATLQAGNPGSTYSWSNGSTASSITVSTAGNYFVTITDVNGCTGQLMHTLNVNPNPLSDFAVSPNCEGTDVSFNNLASITSGTIQTYNWDFGDTSSSNLSNPVHAYSTSGTFTVSLTVTSASGCTGTASKNLIIHPNPVAAFSSPAACEGTNSVFSDASSVSSGTISSWNWNFGDGSSSSGNSPVHSYASYGSYVTTLTVVSDQGCVDSVQENIQIHRKPFADFTGGNACANSNIQFTNSSTSAAGSILFYSWNFGDGNTSSASNPLHNYSSEGTYSVSMSITSSLGCTDSHDLIVTVHPLPLADFNINAACENSNAVITNSSNIGSGSITNYYWNFGDNSSSNLQSPGHTYTASGTYQVELIATSDKGCRDTSVNSVTIHPLPIANFSAGNVCEGAPVEFLDASNVSTGNINSWTWDFGDATGSALDEPVHIYNSAGSYPVQLTVSSDEGCIAHFSTNVIIYPNPTAAFLSSDVCLGNGNTYLNQSSVSGGITYYSMWTFSDGTSSNQTNPSHTFTSAGTFDILLTITSINGCTSDARSTSRVYIPPVSSFLAPDVCQGAVTRFDDNSYSQDGHITKWLWNFGDGSASTEGNPSHLYSGTGQYNVKLTTTSSFGCSNPYEDTVEIYTKPISRIQSANVCEGTDVQFINTTINNTGTNVTYLWDLGNGFTSSDSSLIFNFNQPGTYDVTLTATSGHGCSDTQLNRLSVYPKPLVNFSGTDVCLNSTTSFTNNSTVTSGSIQSYTWDFGDGNTSGQLNTAHQYNYPGVYQVSLTATSNYGCIQNTVSEVLVHPNPTVFFASSYQGCAPITASFNSNTAISSGSISGWLWNFGDGSVSTDQVTQHTFTQGGIFDVSVTVVSDQGCQASYTQTGSVRAFSQPIANFTADPFISDNLSPTVHFTNLSQGFTSYNWTFGDGSSTSTVLNPTHTFADTGIYSAQLVTVNAYGCRDTIMRRIEIKPRSTLFAPNCFTPNGDGSNDRFRPYFTNMTNIQVWIFDRWGLLLTNWEGLEGNWDGYYNGEKCQEDTYVYKIKGTGIDGKYSEWVGHVSIVY